MRNIFRGLYFISFKVLKVFYCMYYFNDGRVALYSDLTIGLKILNEKRTQLPHPFGIVIGKGVKIGYDCRIYQGVTIGSKFEDGRSYPVLGNNVVIYANCVVLGSVKIGNNVIIGASSLVCKDIPDDCIVVGNPAKIIKRS